MVLNGLKVEGIRINSSCELTYGMGRKHITKAAEAILDFYDCIELAMHRQVPQAVRERI